MSAKLEKLAFYSVLPEDKGVLAEQPGDPSHTLRGVRRPVFHKALIDAAERAGVEVKWGHKLVTLEQADDSVTVTFENGEKATGSFVVGCDGLHSNTRKCLFGEQKADFTGLCQVREARDGFLKVIVRTDHWHLEDRRHLPHSRDHEESVRLRGNLWQWSPYCGVHSQRE